MISRFVVGYSKIFADNLYIPKITFCSTSFSLSWNKCLLKAHARRMGLSLLCFVFCNMCYGKKLNKYKNITVLFSFNMSISRKLSVFSLKEEKTKQTKNQWLFLERSQNWGYRAKGKRNCIITLYSSFGKQ